MRVHRPRGYDTALRESVRRAVNRVVDRLPIDVPSRWVANLARRLGYDTIANVEKGGARGWESARTNRVNSARWSLTDDVSVNLWLLEHLKTLRQRCVYESRNNPLIKSAIKTWRVGVVGETGPRLQIQGGSSAFERAAEELWEEFSERPEITGQMSLRQLLDVIVGYEPTRGEYIAQYVLDRSVDDGVQTRLYTIDPRRLESPMATSVLVSSGDDNHTILGIERDRYGRPLRYSFRDDYEAFGYGFRYVWVPASEIVHGYEVEEAGQARGIPWLADCLDDAGHLREFDDATLAAARVAAEHGVLLTTNHPDAQWVEVDSEVEIEPHTISTMPPGYDATHIKPEHPATGYVEFRHERARSIALGFGMPLMMLLLDSSRSNYSSARFDGQLFARAVNGKRIDLSSRLLWPTAQRVFREGALLGRVPALDPREYAPRWRWPPQPHVDPQKEAEAAAKRIELGLSTHSIECAAYGLDYLDEVLPQIAQEREAREAAGVPEPTADPNADAKAQEQQMEQQGAEAAASADRATAERAALVRILSGEAAA